MRLLRKKTLASAIPCSHPKVLHLIPFGLTNLINIQNISSLYIQHGIMKREKLPLEALHSRWALGLDPNNSLPLLDLAQTILDDSNSLKYSEKPTQSPQLWVKVSSNTICNTTGSSTKCACFGTLGSQNLKIIYPRSTYCTTDMRSWVVIVGHGHVPGCRGQGLGKSLS